MKTTGETAFGTVIEAHLLDSGYLCVADEGFDRARDLSGYPHQIFFLAMASNCRRAALRLSKNPMPNVPIDRDDPTRGTALSRY